MFCIMLQYLAQNEKTKREMHDKKKCTRPDCESGGFSNIAWIVDHFHCKTSFDSFTLPAIFSNSWFPDQKTVLTDYQKAIQSKVTN